MYLKKLILHGFKSFANRTEIAFQPGVTAIVGPNGSGKSNISDAIRWVLGEQSPRSLRSQRMEDVIFAGGDGKRPAGFAEVGLIFSNEDGALPLDFDEISVARRVFRSGESEYLINKARCRLKDIERVFGAGGIGRDGYSIIEQGRIDAILGDRGDRRAFFEEASGISDYKLHASGASYELDQLALVSSRIQDILTEIEKFLLPLEDKASRARIYLEHKKRLRDAELAYYLEERRLILGKRDEAAERKAGILREQEVLAERKVNLGSQLEATRQRLISLEEEQDAAREEENRLVTRLERERAELSFLRERTGRMDALTARIEEMKAELTVLAHEIESLQSKEVELDEREKRLKAAIAEGRGRAESFRTDLIDVLNRIASKKNDISAVQREIERKGRLRNEIAERARKGGRAYSPSVHAVMAWAREKKPTGVLGVIGELITVPADYREAIDVALGRSVEDIVTRSERDAREAIGFLKSNNLGRATFLPLDTLAPALFPGALLRTLTARWQVRLACDLVEHSHEILPAVRYLLGRILVVRDLNTAIAVSRACETRFKVVTLEGDVVYVGGAITGGSPASGGRGQGPELELRMVDKELRELEESKTRFAGELSRLVRQRDEINLQVERIAEQEKELEAERETCIGELTGIKVRLGRLLQEEGAAKRTFAELAAEKDRLLEVLAEHDGDLASDAITRKEEGIRGLSASLSAVRERITTLKSDRAKLAGQIRSYEGELRKADEEFSSLGPRMSQCEADLASYRAKLDEVERRLREDIGVDPDAIEASPGDGPEHTTREELREEIMRLREAINALGPVDTDVIVDYERMKERRDRVAGVLSDLARSSGALRDIILLGERLAEKRFLSTFNELGREFGSIFCRLFGGGKAELALADPARPLESSIEVLPMPPGKKFQSLSLLSAGERALCAMSLLFAALVVNPCPFVVLDEADASLDEANLLRFISLLRELAERRQFIIITHRKSTMEACDALYGVTMEEPGVSRVISINLEDKAS